MSSPSVTGVPLGATFQSYFCDNKQSLIPARNVVPCTHGLKGGAAVPPTKLRGRNNSLMGMQASE